MCASEMIRARLLPDGSVVQVLADGTTRPFEDRTDWARLDAMTEEEIEANALSDPDNPPLTADELARMRRSTDPRLVRLRLKLTQEQFSTQFNLPISTVRDWEQGKTKPDGVARTLLRVIDHNPEAVLKALAS